MAEAYVTDKLIGGEIKTQQVKLAAGTYHRGNPLEYVADNDNWKYVATEANVQGVFLEDSRTIAANGAGSIIIGGEVQAGGLTNNTGAAYTVSEDFIASCAAKGLYIKRQ